MSTIFNKNKTNYLTQPMFFGGDLGVARYDVYKYSKFNSFTEQQLGYFWRPEETALSKDRTDFNNSLTQIEQRVFIKNLQYQILLDSVQGRAPSQVFMPICSLPELENWLETWTFSEQIHSRSYTHIIRNVFSDPSEVFEEILDVPEIMKRASSVTIDYDRLHEANLHLALGKAAISKKDHYKLLLKCLVSVFALEAIRFYVSFACSYSFAERGLMEGNAKIITFINRDEFLHQGSTHFMLRKFLSGEEGEGLLPNHEEIREIVEETFLSVYEQECEWAEYLFAEGNIPLLTSGVLKDFLGYLVNSRYRDLGFNGDIVTAPNKNPLPWTESYMKSHNTQTAPQETEISSYMIGAIDVDDDLCEEDLDF